MILYHRIAIRLAVFQGMSGTLLLAISTGKQMAQIITGY